MARVEHAAAGAEDPKGTRNTRRRSVDDGAVVLGASSLTWQGHEFLDAIRNDTIWNKTKNVVAERGGAIPFELIKELAIKLARTAFDLG